MAIATAAGIGMSLIASEHLYSTMLSSPWTTKKFVESETDKQEVRRLYIYATALSITTAVVMSIILNQWYPLFATVALCVIYIVVYERAMEGRI